MPTESFAAVVAEVWNSCPAQMPRLPAALERLEAAHARELAEQQAIIEALRTDKAALLNTCANYETLQRETEARTDAAMGLVAKWRTDKMDDAHSTSMWDQGFAYARNECADELEQTLAGKDGA